MQMTRAFQRGSALSAEELERVKKAYIAGQ
jgi:hypothetical protein